MTTKDYQKKSGLSIFLSFFRPHRKLFALDLGCALLVSLIDLCYPIVSRTAMHKLLPVCALHHTQVAHVQNRGHARLCGHSVSPRLRLTAAKRAHRCTPCKVV